MSDKTDRDVQGEFTRQARPMADAPAFHAGHVLQWFVCTVGDAPQARVLDVACGPGIVAEAIAPHVAELVGIDATPEMIRLAEERFAKAGLENGRFEVAPAEHLPFEAASFDQVVTRLSFHHLPDVPLVMKEIRRVLKPHGKLLAADIVCAYDWVQAALHNALEQLRDPTHVQFSSHAELIRMIDAAGFRVHHQEIWQQQRSFDEWAAIVADPVRMKPLETIMHALARGGQDAGIDLRQEEGVLRFTHTWLLVEAESG